MAPVTTITETEQYIGAVTWTPSVSGTFAAETDYTAAIMLTAKSGYTFNGVEENFFTVEGATTVSNAANLGAVTAKFFVSVEASSITWKITDDGTLIISGKGAMPDYLWDDTPGSAAPWANHRSSITALVIEPGVTSIGNYAFWSHSNITGSLTLPQGITSIGDHAFYGCSGFTGSLTLPQGITSIGDLAFANCTGFTGDLTLPQGLTSIGYSAFASCRGFTGNLTLPDGITNIDWCTFYLCSGFTGSLTLPKGLTRIGEHVFSGCSGFTGSLTLPEELTTIGDEAFYRCSSFNGSLTLPQSLTSINRSAFSGCSGFTEVINHQTTPVTIEPSTFAALPIGTIRLNVPAGSVNKYSKATVWEDFGCISEIGGVACELNIPRSGIDGEIAWRIDEATNTLIISRHSGNGAMRNYSLHDNNGTTAPWILLKNSINDLVIEPGVTSIGNYAFSFNDNLTGSLTLPEGVTIIGDMAFARCSGFTGSLTLPEGLTNIGFYAFAYCDGFTGSLTLPKGLTSIGNLAFVDCHGFTGSLSLPEGLTNISSYAFSGCSGFTGNLILPKGLTIIDDGAFQRCSGLTEVTIHNSMTSIGFNAFAGCNGLTTVIFNAVNCGAMGSDGRWGISTVFSGCNNLTTVKIGNEVKAIPAYAFYHCSSLTEIISYATTPPTISNSNAFFHVDKTTCTLRVPAASVAAYKAAAGWNDFVNIVALE